MVNRVSIIMAQGMSKTQKKCLIAFSSIFLGLILIIVVHYVEIFNENHPLMIGYFTPVMETFDRYGFVLILGGIGILIYISSLLTNLFNINGDGKDSNLDEFNWDETYELKSGLFTIKRNNQTIIIQKSKEKELKVIVFMAIGVLTLSYLAEPMTFLVFNNLNLNNPMYRDSNLIMMLLYTFMILIFDFLLVTFLYLMIREVLRDTFIVIDPVIKQIRYKSRKINPIEKIGGKFSEITFPLENLETMEVIMQEYKVVNASGRKPKIKEMPTITIATKNWVGDEKLFTKLTSRKDRERIKIMANTDSRVLDKIKTFLVEYATKET